MCYKRLNDKNTHLYATRCPTQFARLLSQVHMLKINWDQRAGQEPILAGLVSSNRENFRILTVRRYDTFSLRGGH